MNAANANCPRCGDQADASSNRLVTDSCGRHQKCRRCFLDEEQQCLECKREHDEVTKKTDNGGEKKSKIAVTPTPAHVQQMPTSKPGEVQFHCSICDKSFRSRSQRYYHLGCGNESAKKYKCTQCERCFGSRSHLNYHLESHTAQVHRCTQCTQSFKNHRVLQKHQKRHDASQSVNCPQCGKLFRCKEYLAPHLDAHHNNLRFECSVCGRKYGQKSALKQHMQKHLGKQHACSHCGKYFQRNSTLKLHLRRHSKTESFGCKTCKKIFNDSVSLKRHAKIHEKTVVKYKCTHCDITTVRKDNMLRHVRNMHPGEAFNACVEIIREQEHVPNTSQKTESTFDAPPIETDASDEEFLSEKDEEEDGGGGKEHSTQQQPKSIENSCVIRCIGNVEPVQVPNTSIDLTRCAEVVEPTDQIIATAGAATTLTLTNLENVCFNFIDKATLTTHKKLKTKYDPIELYRKILLSDDEEAAGVESRRHINISAVAVETAETSAKLSHQQPTGMTSKPVEQQQRATSINNSNGQLHWRKNFKYTYQYQDY